MDNQITVREKTQIVSSLNDLQQLGNIFIKSGLFEDTKTEAQAIVKIMAGQEMGVEPFAAMAGIDIIKGKVAVKPILLAAKLKQSGKYNYRVIEQSSKRCVIDFYEGKTKIGQSIFTTEDAAKLNLLGKYNWKAQPNTMMFWRALSKGIRQFAPDLYMAPIYIPDEIEAADTKVAIAEEPEPEKEVPKMITEAKSQTEPEKEERKPEDKDEEVIKEPPPVSKKPKYLTKTHKATITKASRDIGVPDEVLKTFLDENYGDAKTIPDTEYERLLDAVRGGALQSHFDALIQKAADEVGGEE